MDTKYIKIGGRYYFMSGEVNDELIPKCYLLEKDKMKEEMYLLPTETPSIPSKLYGDVSKLADRIYTTCMDRGSSTGILLNGNKGSGKTVTVKSIVRKCITNGIPAIFVNEAYSELGTVINSLNKRCLIILDEFEKTYKDRDDQDSLLSILDGVYPSKHIFLLTSNSTRMLVDALINRPGRIYYFIEFGQLEESVIVEYCKEHLKKTFDLDKEIKTMINLSKINSEFSFDQLKSLVEEMNRFGESVSDVLKYLSIRPPTNMFRPTHYTIDLYIDSILRNDALKFTCTYVELQEPFTIDTNIGELIEINPADHLSGFNKNEITFKKDKYTVVLKPVKDAPFSFHKYLV